MSIRLWQSRVQNYYNFYSALYVSLRLKPFSLVLFLWMQFNQQVLGHLRFEFFKLVFAKSNCSLFGTFKWDTRHKVSSLTNLLYIVLNWLGILVAYEAAKLTEIIVGNLKKNLTFWFDPYVLLCLRGWEGKLKTIWAARVHRISFEKPKQGPIRFS